MDLTLPAKPRGWLRHSDWDALLVGLSAVHAAAVLAAPSVPLIALGLWWNANTIAHNFIHRPFFRSKGLNRAYGLWSSALVGVPQTLWRDRHLRHHGGRPRPLAARDAALELLVIASLWGTLAALVPGLFLTTYLPGWGLGLLLCFLHGHFEHAGGRATSHYGRLYNACFFNDGYHAEHHRHPGVHWTALARQLPAADGARSRWPPVLRWLDALSLDMLERLVLASPRLQRFVLAAHEQAFRRLLPSLPRVARVTIVGGGLFPRTALILQKLLPDARLAIVDADEGHLAIARAFLGERVELRHACYDPSQPDAADLTVIPLAFVGDRGRIYRQPPSPATLVHDWIWRDRTEGVRVSWLLLKRLNLITR